MSRRLQRLQAEFEQLSDLFGDHDSIQIAATSGEPPERYVIEYHIEGLVDEQGEIKKRHVHQAQITLGRNYPREAPRCVMLTPVFHPNIDHLAICTEDIRSADQTLDQTIVFIGEMIAYQAFNLQSPRNGDAARWAAEHMDQFPLDAKELMPRALTQGLAAVATPTSNACMTCGSKPAGDEWPFCINQHLICPDCQTFCENCRQPLCPHCPLHHCQYCPDTFCADCVAVCAICQQTACLTHIQPCCTCRQLCCPTHLQDESQCPSCRGAEPHLVISKQEIQTVPAEALGRPATKITLGASESRRTSGKAIASLAFGIAGIPVIGVLVGWVAILFGTLALREVKHNQQLMGEGLAVAGIVLGSFDVLFWSLLIWMMG